MMDECSEDAHSRLLQPPLCLCRNNRLAPSTVPGTDGQLQIMTAIHDGFHTTSATVGPIMTNCTYIGAGGAPPAGRTF